MNTIVPLVGAVERLLIQSRKEVPLMPWYDWGFEGAVLTWELNPLQTSNKGFLPVDQELEEDTQDLLLVSRGML